MWVIGMILYPTWLLGGEKPLTILHTNDLHSHLLGFSPNIDYSPLKTDDDGRLANTWPIHPLLLWRSSRA
jgi:hypothetical protein